MDWWLLGNSLPLKQMYAWKLMRHASPAVGRVSDPADQAGRASRVIPSSKMPSDADIKCSHLRRCLGLYLPLLGIEERFNSMCIIIPNFESHQSTSVLTYALICKGKGWLQFAYDLHTIMHVAPTSGVDQTEFFSFSCLLNWRSYIKWCLTRLVPIGKAWCWW
jgi:hypothetical protein